MFCDFYVRLTGFVAFLPQRLHKWVLLYYRLLHESAGLQSALATEQWNHWLLLKKACSFISRVVIALTWRVSSSDNAIHKHEWKQSNKITQDRVCVCVCICMHGCTFVAMTSHVRCVCLLTCHCLPACTSPEGTLIVLQISPISIYNHSSWDWVFFL